MGVTLLCLVVPDFKSRTLEDFGLSYVPISIIEVSIVASLPVLVANGITLSPAILLISGFLICLLLSRYSIGWFPQKGADLREGEKETINEN